MTSVRATPQDSPHIPVMLEEVLRHMRAHDGALIVDGTLGAGGYTRALLESCACRVVSIDRDPEAHQRAAAWAPQYGTRLHLIHNSFGNVASCVDVPVDGFVLDLGVSSMQLDQAERGFSFRHDGPLDMRMDTSQGESAADLIARIGERDLADLIYLYGEERHSRRIAKAIIEERHKQPIISTAQFANIIRAVMPKPKRDEIDPATRTFQAIRIAVNDELGELERALVGAEMILKPGGRLIVVTFHSLEDRIVKTFMRDRSGDKPAPSRHAPMMLDDNRAPTFMLEQRKPIEASAEEISRNPRARSARMRVAIRTEAPAGPIQPVPHIHGGMR
jgi:16S rRNA (cytosine1402-N4)-methyltransferase